MFFLIFLSKLFGKKTTGEKKIDKKKTNKKINKILFDYAKNISTIDLVINANLSKFLFC